MLGSANARALFIILKANKASWENSNASFLYPTRLTNLYKRNVITVN